MSRSILPPSSLAVAVAACLIQMAVHADEFLLDWSRPACGKVCKLVCETKKLSSICYGCQCKEICIPGPSRPGCKHCATCFGKCEPAACGDCQDHQPKCEFCWRDWFACGCARPRTVRVLTKFQAEKEICWYHWEVVDAACCDCVSKNDRSGAADKNSTKADRTFYKPAPEGAELGDVLAVSDDEWVKLSAVLAPDQMELPATAVVDSPAKPASQPNGELKSLDPNAKSPSIAERLQGVMRR